MNFPILFKYTQKGQIQQWLISTDDDNYWTEEGIQGGTITVSKPTYCFPKNVGKKNETSAQDQAIKEAQAKWQKKVDSGYNEVLSKEKKFFEPMLAKDAKESKDLPPMDQEDVEFEVDVYAQPKLDGLRAVNEDNSLMSRNGKPYLACPHLYQDKWVLDGELYNHNLRDDFNKIVSLCKKQKPTDEELKESQEKVQFWCYDLPSHKGTFSQRYEVLKVLSLSFGDAFKLVPTEKVKNWKEVKEFHLQCLEMGYEGTMLRLDNAPYENKRSKSLLKYKDFIDEEFEIIGAEEGTGGRAGTIGYFIIQHDVDPNKTFKSNVKGDFGYLEQVWKDRDKYTGTMATIKYFNRTPDNVPRFPYIIKLNRAEYE